MKKIQLILLALLSALLLSLAWQNYFTVFIFIAFVPLLFIADEFFWTKDSKEKEMQIVGSANPGFLIPVRSVKRKGLRKFGLFYLSFLVWNLLTTWWVYNASPAAIMAWTLNSLFMAWTFRLAWWAKKRFTGTWAYFILIPFWLSFEYLHQQWDLSWTWLTIGNVFANQNELVQWYEITGTSGGSAWVLFVNILVFLLLKKRLELKVWSRKLSSSIVAALFVPTLLSYILFITVDDRLEATRLKAQKVIVIQPNIDPYNEKFSSDPQVQMEKTLSLINKNNLPDSADYLVFPETFLTSNMWENDLPNTSEILYLREKLISKYPTIKIITGANTLKQYGSNEKPSATAHKFTQEEGYYDYYNSAIQIDSSNYVQVYRKSKLVPGSEIMPFLWLLKPLENYALDLGGTVGSLGLQKERSVFLDRTTGIKVAPIICYESVYPEYVGEYVSNGANMLFIITNDGWWGDTPGYKQHLAYGALRAIETRKPIARSANTGTSCFVTEKGKVYQATAWWKPDVIQANLTPNTYQTFFIKAGDVFAKAALILSGVLFVLALFRRIIKR